MMNPRGFVAEGSGEELRAISFDSRAAKASYLICLALSKFKRDGTGTRVVGARRFENDERKRDVRSRFSVRVQ